MEPETIPVVGEASSCGAGGETTSSSRTSGGKTKVARLRTAAGQVIVEPAGAVSATTNTVKGGGPSAKVAHSNILVAMPEDHDLTDLS